MLEAVRRLIDHLRWADDKVLAALRAHSSPPERALELYRHILGAEAVWLARIRGEPSPLPVWPTLDLDQAGREAAALHAALAELVAGLDPTALEREIAYTNSAGRSFRTPLGAILLHLTLHGVNHRGQISQLLRQAGLEPVTTDYIEFVRGVPAATRQPEARRSRA
jgi:uncharacterized damage-inducible protein DinB